MDLNSILDSEGVATKTSDAERTKFLIVPHIETSGEPQVCRSCNAISRQSHASSAI